MRVAIVGSGPAGFYAAEHLLKREHLSIEVDMFDRLPTPFGLVRAGVAPDHPKIKSVIRVYEKTAAREGFRFFGNVDVGSDLTVAELEARYNAVVYAYGTATDRKLGIPGED
ncbi:MAG: FAD-dependent oxidoreductase, partial [Solirubrobacterales bacterium]